MKLSRGIPGWIDFSPTMQRLTRNAIAALSVPGAIDELGIGVFRDSISNLLFPGTTVTMTRAVYLAFLPACMRQTEKWLFKEWTDERISPTAERYHAEMRQLQNSFCKKNGETTGIIGRDNYKKIRDDDADADAYIVRYPFSIYWNALCRWDLIPGGKDENGNVMSAAAYIQKTCQFIHEGKYDPDERWDRFDCGVRNASAEKRNHCSLFPEEQKFIKDQMIRALPDTLLGAMVENGFDAESFLPDSLNSRSIVGIPLEKLSEKIRTGVEDMVFFTAFMRTAFSAYNALLNWNEHQEEFRKSLRTFREKYSMPEAEVRLTSMKARVGASPGNDTALFLEEWMKKCLQTPDNAVPDLSWIAKRENCKKTGGRAKILKAWGGDIEKLEQTQFNWDESIVVPNPEKEWIGMDVLDYRWKETSRLVIDLLTNTYSGEASNAGK